MILFMKNIVIYIVIIILIREKNLLKIVMLSFVYPKIQKKTLLNYIKFLKKKIFVTPLGYDHLDNIDTLDIKKNPFYEKPFILYVGGRYKYKNFK